MGKFIIKILLLMIIICPTYAKAEVCTPSGNQVICKDDEGKVTRTLEVKQGNPNELAMKDCKPLAAKIAEFSTCSQCPMYLTLFNAANEVITKAFIALTSPLIIIMSVAFAIIIAFKVLAQVSSISQVSANKLIDDLIKQGAKFVIAFSFLTLSDQFFYWVFNPVLTAGIEMGAGFLTKGQSISNATTTLGVSGDYISAEVYAKIEAFSITVQESLSIMQAIGSSLMCIGLTTARHWFILPDIALLVNGGIMYGYAIMISIAFGYYLIDGMLQLCIAGIMTPFSVAAYPFNFSQKWMMTTWKCFLDTFFKFVFMGLVISIIIEIMSFAVSGGDNGTDDLIEIINTNTVEEITDRFNIFSITFITMVACSIFAGKMTEKASELAATMSGGSMVSAGSALGTMVISAITNPIKKLANKPMQKAKKAAAKKLKGAAKGAGNAVKGGAKKFASSVKNKVNKGGGK